MAFVSFKPVNQRLCFGYSHTSLRVVRECLHHRILKKQGQLQHISMLLSSTGLIFTGYTQIPIDHEQCTPSKQMFLSFGRKRAFEQLHLLGTQCWHPNFPPTFRSSWNFRLAHFFLKIVNVYFQRSFKNTNLIKAKCRCSKKMNRQVDREKEKLPSHPGDLSAWAAVIALEVWLHDMLPENMHMRMCTHIHMHIHSCHTITKCM